MKQDSCQSARALDVPPGFLAPVAVSWQWARSTTKCETWESRRRFRVRLGGVKNLCAMSTVWKVGIGANLNLNVMTARRKLNVLDHQPARLPGYAIAFHEGLRPFMVEPAFATIRLAEEGDVCVHGLAVLLSEEDARKLDRQEGASKVYSVEEILAELYDGRKVKAEVYVAKWALSSVPPSKRYLTLMIEGARMLGVHAEYLNHLESLPYYIPSEETIRKRSLWPKPQTLPPITLSDMQEHKKKEGARMWYSLLGYVFERNRITFSPLLREGCDSSARRLAFLRCQSLDSDDNARPFPRLDQLSSDEREYFLQAMDNDTATEGVEMVGHLVEFWEDQVLDHLLGDLCTAAETTMTP
uniref:gamma-glutamylcyclotransferase n=1 Tax=Compsopogon caeruleus TaxID=31354 RepID=A0A7S1TC95_9RHOD